MSVEYKDYYATLGIPRRASDEEVKRAFRRLAREYHPDVAKDKKGAEDRFKEINEAYEVLGNPENRRRYDELGGGWRDGATFRPPPGWEARGRPRRPRPDPEEDFEFQFGGTGFSSFFESLFGGRRPGERGMGAGPGERGGDVESDILVALDEVLHGSVRTITQERVNGRTGQVDRTGLQVRIPPGVREGQLIRVSRRGEPGPDGRPGDLYLRVHYAKHPDYRVRDRDLWGEVALAPWEAVLGATVTIRSLDGPLSLKVPPGSRAGQQLRIRGRGLPGPEGQRGDLYVVVEIEVPTSITDEEKILWEKLAAGSRFRPRPEVT